MHRFRKFCNWSKAESQGCCSSACNRFEGVHLSLTQWAVVITASLRRGKTKTISVLWPAKITGVKETNQSGAKQCSVQLSIPPRASLPQTFKGLIELRSAQSRLSLFILLLSTCLKKRPT